MTYEYLCTSCGHEWEASQPISADPLKDCPSCHRSTARRQVSGGTGFVLKGGGWYADLYGSTKPSANKDGAEKSTSESKGEASAQPSASEKPAASEKASSDEKRTSRTGAKGGGKEGSSGGSADSSAAKSTATKDSGKGTSSSGSTRTNRDP